MSGDIIDYKVGGIDLKLFVGEDTFKPNLTTQLLANSLEVKEGSTVLELGCGIAPLSIMAAKKGAAKVVAVDIMKKACENAQKNVEINGVSDRVKILNGSLFEPIKDQKFDVIINDVSGMAEAVSRISPWYPDSIPAGGHDGTAQTVTMLEESKKYLNGGGSLYFPVLSLADSPKILRKAMDVYGDGLQLLSEKWVPFCKEFKEKIVELEAMKKEGIIDFITKRSRQLWQLRIYSATAAML
ncbi:MAG: methyltransferase [Kiritimatiellae bacterium]|nr:methyltransferase [Kiritimatiellia bacterium]